MKKTAILVGVVFLLFSCSSGEKGSSEADSTNSTNSGKSYDCLKEFEDNYGGLLSQEEITAVYPVDFDNAKEELRSGSYGEYIYTWPSDRADMNLEISGMNVSVPDQNIIGVKMLSFYSDDTELKSARATFDMGYKELSDQELKQIQDNLSKQSDEIKESAEGFMAVRNKRVWDAVDGLGSSSWYKWNENYGGELVVLAGRASFTVVMKTSKDPDANRKMAIKLAEKVLAKCN